MPIPGNRTKGAIEFYDKALSWDPKHVGALDGKGQGLTALGNYTGEYATFYTIKSWL